MTDDDQGDVRMCKKCPKKMRWVESGKDPKPGEKRARVPLDYHPAHVYRIVDGRAVYLRVVAPTVPERVVLLEQVAELALMCYQGPRVEAIETELGHLLTELEGLLRPSDDPVPVYTSHFATCPNADEFRRKRRNHER